MNEEFMKGWNAARAAWQGTGSVSPMPADEAFVQTKVAGGMKEKDARALLAKTKATPAQTSEKIGG